MLSLILEKDHPKWKPLHIPASYKPKERRMAKQAAKANWFKSRKEQGKSTDAQQMVRTEWKSE